MKRTIYQTDIHLLNEKFTDVPDGFYASYLGNYETQYGLMMKWYYVTNLTGVPLCTHAFCFETKRLADVPIRYTHRYKIKVQDKILDNRTFGNGISMFRNIVSLENVYNGDEYKFSSKKRQMILVKSGVNKQDEKENEFRESLMTKHKDTVFSMLENLHKDFENKKLTKIEYKKYRKIVLDVINKRFTFRITSILPD